MELGCGAGVTGIGLHRVGASAVVLTDSDASSLQNCRHNLEINGVLQSINHEGSPDFDTCQVDTPGIFRLKKGILTLRLVPEDSNVARRLSEFSFVCRARN